MGGLKAKVVYQFLDDRENQELELARYYAKYYHHGTSGHLAYMLISKLADELDYWKSKAVQFDQDNWKEAIANGYTLASEADNK